MPPLLCGSPWAVVAVRLGDQTTTWSWNAGEAAPTGPGAGPSPDANGHVEASDTIVRWASLAKPVTALIVLRLATLGRVGLDDPAIAHSPSFHPSPAQLAGHRADGVTIRHLLTHASGMGVFRYPPIAWRETRPPSADMLRRTDAPLAWSLAHAPGAAVTYGSAAYVWLQSIIEDVARQPFELAARTLLLDPLALPRVALLGDDDAPGPIAWGRDARNHPIKPRRSPAPGATGLFATTIDITRLFGGLVTPDRRLAELIAPELLAGVTQNQTPRAAEAWGLGWRLQESGDGVVFRHAGASDGVTAYVEGLPRLQLLTCLQIGCSGARRALVRIADIARWHARGAGHESSRTMC